MSKLNVRIGNGKILETTGGETVTLDTLHVNGLDGNRLTDDNIDAEVRSAAAKLGKLGGRPRIAVDEETVGLSVKVPVSTREALRDRAKAKGVNQAEILRDALEAYLAAS